MRYAIFDLDNCISNDAWRIPHIDWSAEHPDNRYRKYHALCGFDQVGNWMRVQSCLRSGIAIIVFTARPLEVRDVTEEWLRRAGIPVAELMMRNPGDRRPSTELKCWQLECLLSPNNGYGVEGREIELAFDDRPDVVQMYREAREGGLIPNCVPEVLALHSVCAYTPPGKVPS